MVVEKRLNIALEGKHQRPIVMDLVYREDGRKKPILIFCHGYKGFKDWGAWNLMAEAFAEEGLFFVKFNFSHNGGTLENPIDFPDLEAFSQNTYTKEMDDLEVVLDWITAIDNSWKLEFDANRITLMGHSRGGGSAIIKAGEDSRIKKLVTLASVSDFGSRFPKGDELEAWKEHGVGYVENARTKQKMPHLYSFYEDFTQNEDRFTIGKVVQKLKIPMLIIHGTQDETVDISNAYDLKRWNPQAEMLILENSNHVFEASHPWESSQMPAAYQQIISRVTQFVHREKSDKI